MGFCRPLEICLLLALAVTAPAGVSAQSESSSSNSPKHLKKHLAAAPDIDSGTVSNGVYRNETLALSWKIPDGWVLRTEEMNADNEEAQSAAGSGEGKSSSQRAQGNTEGKSKVLLAAFSRPPGAQGEDVNSSILIAAEPAATYPGLKEPVQYLGVLTETAEAQGFTTDAEPYEIAVGPKALVREDYHKDVGTRVMQQSTMAMLERGYAVSITVIGGTEDEVEDLLDGLEFAARKPVAK